MKRAAIITIALVATAGFAQAGQSHFASNFDSHISQSSKTSDKGYGGLQLSAPGEIRISPNNDSR